MKYFRCLALSGEKFSENRQHINTSLPLRLITSFLSAMRGVNQWLEAQRSLNPILSVTCDSSLGNVSHGVAEFDPRDATTTPSIRSGLSSCHCKEPRVRGVLQHSVSYEERIIPSA